jgi:hypothetical protein
MTRRRDRRSPRSHRQRRLRRPPATRTYARPVARRWRAATSARRPARPTVRALAWSAPACSRPTTIAIGLQHAGLPRRAMAPRQAVSTRALARWSARPPATATPAASAAASAASRRVTPPRCSATMAARCPVATPTVSHGNVRRSSGYAGWSNPAKPGQALDVTLARHLRTPRLASALPNSPPRTPRRATAPPRISPPATPKLASAHPQLASAHPKSSPPRTPRLATAPPRSSPPRHCAPSVRSGPDQRSERRPGLQSTIVSVRVSRKRASRW